MEEVWHTDGSTAFLGQWAYVLSTDAKKDLHLYRQLVYTIKSPRRLTSACYFFMSSLSVTEL